MQPDGPSMAPPLRKAPTGRGDLESAAEPSSAPPVPDAQIRGKSTPPLRGLKRDSTILQELEAGAREEEERNNLNSRLFELGTELRKVRYGLSGGFSEICAFLFISFLFPFVV